jgi:small subunit ribosomal protein S21
MADLSRLARRRRLASLQLRREHVAPQLKLTMLLHPAGRPAGSRPGGRIRTEKGTPLQVLVRDNNVDQALRVLKKKMQREGIFREMKQRRSYEKPSERKTREKSEAIRRARKAARKQAQREGLLPPPKKKLMNDKRGSRPGMAGAERGGMGGARTPRF